MENPSNGDVFGDVANREFSIFVMKGVSLGEPNSFSPNPTSLLVYSILLDPFVRSSACKPNSANILRHYVLLQPHPGESPVRAMRGAFPSPLAPFSNPMESSRARLTG